MHLKNAMTMDFVLFQILSKAISFSNSLPLEWLEQRIDLLYCILYSVCTIIMFPSLNRKLLVGLWKKTWWRPISRSEKAHWPFILSLYRLYQSLMSSIQKGRKRPWNDSYQYLEHYVLHNVAYLVKQYTIHNIENFPKVLHLKIF